jgi:hypothetical protein
MLTPTFNQARQLQRQYPSVKGIMGLGEMPFGLKLAHDLHSDLGAFAVLQSMLVVMQ